ncbi:DUF4355 domain-containing protein [Oscillospiraceae bacterium 21-37]|nr:DUF4355 domain-containing protein [bacterium D16-76]
MADEVNTTQGTAAPAVGTPQAAPEAAPTQEQQNAFQRFLGSLFGGKAEAPAPAEGTDTTPAPAPKQEPEGKTYTEAQLQAQLEAAKAQWAAQQQEEARLSKLPPEERAKAEADAQKKEVEDLRAQLLQRDLKDAALKQLEKDGFPAGLAELLTYTDKESMEKSMAHAQEVFKSCLEAAVKERLRGKTPEGLGGAASAENAIKDQIAQNIRGGLN